MKKVILALAMAMIVVLGIASSASAFEGGGRKPSEAPLVAVGQHYSGELNNHKDDANYGGFREIALYRLPPILTRDVVVIDWHGAPYTRYPGEFPFCLQVGQGLDDFNWAEYWERTDSDDCYELSASGSARSEFVAQATDSNAYLEFSVPASRTSPSDYEAYPYDFTVLPILHYMAVTLKEVKRVSATGVITATALGATGQPVPDGLGFNLEVTWPDGGIASFSGTSSGGVVTVPLALPETAFGKTATFVLSHPADGTYQGTSTPKVRIKVAKPKAPPPSPCESAERRELILTRQFKRLRRHAARARGVTKRYLSRRAHRVKRKLHLAQLRTDQLCGG